MDKKKMERISELTRISRERELTPEEQTEREALRNEYRASVRANFTGVLENTYIQTPSGKKYKAGTLGK